MKVVFFVKDDILIFCNWYLRTNRALKRKNNGEVNHDIE